MWSCVTTLLLALCLTSVQSLDNGLARTPPMGWLSWERFLCNTDCRETPDECIGERLLTETADAMASQGYKDVGYEFVNVDDCWSAHDRDADGKITVDKDRFPSGMKKMIDYIHSKGIKFGLYGDVGTKTCAGHPGSQDHYQKDAQTFADWGVDMLKFDGCNIKDQEQFERGYKAMRDALNATGRPIVYSCEWLIYPKVRPDRKLVAETCNTFRIDGDIWDDWNSIYNIINHYGDHSKELANIAGPGNWNDPDMLVVGNYGLSFDQEQVQFGFWCLLSAPLLMSVDLRNVRASSKAILQNKAAIAINQDPLGKQAIRVSKIGRDFSIWMKPVVPVGSFAIGVLNTHAMGGPIKLWVKIGNLGMNNTHGYEFTDVFSGQNLGILKPKDTFTTRINPTGMKLIKAKVLSGGGDPPKLIEVLSKRVKTVVVNSIEELDYDKEIEDNVVMKRN